METREVAGHRERERERERECKRGCEGREEGGKKLRKSRAERVGGRERDVTGCRRRTVTTGPHAVSHR